MKPKTSFFLTLLEMKRYNFDPTAVTSCLQYLQLFLAWRSASRRSDCVLDTLWDKEGYHYQLGYCGARGRERRGYHTIH